MECEHGDTMTADLISEEATKWLVGVQDEGVIYILGRAGQSRDGVGFHHATWNGPEFKTYWLFISGIFHLLWSDCSWPWVTETTEVKLLIMGNYCIYISQRKYESQMRETVKKRFFFIPFYCSEVILVQILFIFIILSLMIFPAECNHSIVRRDRTCHRNKHNVIHDPALAIEFTWI